jgi:hypothetical protein
MNNPAPLRCGDYVSNDKWCVRQRPDRLSIVSNPCRVLTDNLSGLSQLRLAAYACVAGLRPGDFLYSDFFLRPTACN